MGSASQERVKDTKQLNLDKQLFQKMPVQKIDIPEQIIKQHDFCEKIEYLNQKAYLQVEYLKKLTDKSHRIYSDSSQSILKLIDLYQNKIVNCEGASQVCASQFFSSIKQIYTNLDQQVKKNIIYINAKKKDNIKSINQVIERKMKEVSIRIGDLKAQIQQYNKIAQKYQKKAEYFSDLERDPIKFYSIKKNQDKYKRINELQFTLEGNLDKIQKIKSDIKTLFLQLTIKVKYYFDSIKAKVDELKKISLTLRMKNFPKLKAIEKISEVSEEAEYSVAESPYQSPRNYTSQEKKQNKLNFSPEAEIKISKKEAQKQFHSQSQIQNIVIEFLINFVKEVKITQVQIKEIQEEKEFKFFKTNQIFQFLNNKTIDGIEKIFAESQNFFKIMDKIVIIASADFFKEVLKYRTQIFKSFIEKTENLLDEREQYSNQQLLRCYHEIERKYQETNKQSKYRFCEKIGELLGRFRDLFQSEAAIEKRKCRNEPDILSKRYYEILKLPYFLNNEPLNSLQKEKSILRYEKNIKFNKFLQAEFELQSQMNLQSGKKIVIKTSCCGLIKSKQQIIEKRKIDSFSCALKDGFMLYQGKIQLFEQYLRFKSSFNPHNFFGSTDIYIPKWDIEQIVKGTHIVSQLISVVTKHGNIQLTSFFSDPYELLADLYCTKSHVHQRESMIEQSELQDLQSCFENSFSLEAQQQKLEIKEHSIVRSDKNTLVVRYLYRSMKQKQMEIYFFQVTIKYFENAMEYTFMHSDEQKNLAIKKKLESIAQSIIHKDRKRKIKNPMKMKDESQDMQISFDFNDVSHISRSPQAFNHSLTGDFMNLGIKQSSSNHHHKKSETRNSFLSEMRQNPENSPQPNLQNSFTNSLSRKSINPNISHSALTVKQGHHRSRSGSKIEKSSSRSEEINQQIRTEGYKMIIILVALAILILAFVSKLA